MVNQGAIGGAAGESGSNHRSIAAALVAANGLNGYSVPWLGPDAWPVRIGLETDNEVDDMEVVLSDGSAIHVQAKSSCDLGREYKKSVAQWASAVSNGTASAADRFVLLVAAASGSLRELGTALDHLRAGTSLPDGEARRVDGAVQLLTDRHNLSITAARELLGKVHLVILDTSSAGQAVQLGSALLDASVVSPGSGKAAFAILESFLHDQSRQRRETGITDWMATLRLRGITVHSDPSGVLAARLQAEEDEISVFRLALASRKDEVSFPSTEIQLNNYIRAGCSQELRVRAHQARADARQKRARRPDEHSLLDVTRRQGRYLLVGGPGTGKSFSLEQLAANFAANAAAPLPLPFRLRDLAKAMEERPTVSWGFRELANQLAGDNAVLERALLSSMADGFVIYLFDGLDEVARERSKVASWLSGFLNSLKSHTDLVISSRYPAAMESQVDLPQFEVLPPRDLDALADELLVKFSERVHDEFARAEWLKKRRSFVELSQRQDADLWAVPLLAMLMISILAVNGPTSIPRSRSGLLRAALASSVKRWEMPRIDSIAPGLPYPYQAQIVVDTFADIAGVVAVDGQWKSALEAVERRLEGAWDIPLPAVPDWARAILGFWDSTAAIFVTSVEEGRLTARSRLFTEIGVAMLLARDSDAMQAWVLDKKSDPESFVTMRLLCGLKEDAMEWIGQIAADGEEDLLDLVLDAVDEGATLSDAILRRVLDAQLRRLPLLPRSTDRSQDAPRTNLKSFLTRPADPAHRLGIRLARQPLTKAQQDVLRDFAKSHLVSPQKAVLLALLEIRNPQFDVQSDAHWRLIEDALPPKPEKSRAEGYIAPWQDVDVLGLEFVASYAAEKLDVSRANLASRVMAAAEISSYLGSDEVRKMLVAKGFRNEVALLDSGIGTSFLAGFPESFTTTTQPLQLLKESLGEPEECSAHDLWHLDAAAAAYGLLRANDVSFGQLYWAVEHHPVLSGQVVKKMVEDSPLPTGKVAAQIRAIFDEDPAESRLLSIPSNRTIRARLSPSSDWEECALSAWKSRNDWLGLLGFTMFLAAEEVTDSTIGALEKMLFGATPAARKQIGVVAEYHRPGQAWTSEDALCRSGSRRVQAVHALRDNDYARLAQYLQEPDLEIRNESVCFTTLPEGLIGRLPSVPDEAVCWTCWQCGQAMAITDDACSRSHPRPDDKLAERLRDSLAGAAPGRVQLHP